MKIKQKNIFYGWYVVTGLLVSGVGAGTLSPFGFSPFVRPISEAFGWKRGFVASGISVRLITGALFSTIVGRIVDRHGARVIMLAAGCLGATCMLLMAGVTQPWQYLTLFAIAGGVTAAGAGELIVGTVIPKWFIVRRGWALAFATMGSVIVGVVFTPIIANHIATYGWQGGWILVAAIMFATIIPASLVMRRKPEDLGLSPDGNTHDRSDISMESLGMTSDSEVMWKPNQAVRTPVFWLMLLGFNLSGLAITGIVVHELSYLTELGYLPRVAALVVSVHAFSGICGRFVWGYLVDRWPVRFCLATTYLGAGLATVLLIHADVTWIAFLFAIIYGLNIGGSDLLNDSAWSNYYGRAFLGSIRGVVLPFQVISRAAGPVMSGLLYDYTGSYTTSLVIFVGTFALGGLLFSVLRPPK